MIFAILFEILKVMIIFPFFSPQLVISFLPSVAYTAIYDKIYPTSYIYLNIPPHQRGSDGDREAHKNESINMMLSSDSPRE